MIKSITINKIKIYIADEHNEVLQAWGDFKRNNQNNDYNLITFDTHTDFNEGFIKYTSNRVLKKEIEEKDYKVEKTKMLNNINFVGKNKKEFDDIVNILENDEHIDIATRGDIIKNVFVITWEDRENAENRRIYNITKKCKLSTDNVDKALEDRFLSPQIIEIENILGNSFFKEKYILDIDLDYFQSKASIKPKQKDIFYELIKNAEIITIALEKNFLKDNVENRGAEDLEAEYLLDEILKHIETASI